MKRCIPRVCSWRKSVNAKYRSECFENLIVVFSGNCCYNCWSKRSSSGRLKAFVCDQGTAVKTLRSGVSMRCDIVKANITRRRAKLTITNCR